MTYGEIRTQLIAILNRSDCTDALADTFITQGIQRSQRQLKLVTQERIDEVTVGATFTGIDIPTDFISPIAIYRDDSSVGNYKLRRVSLAEYLDHPTISGSPTIWTRDAQKFLLNPTPVENDVIKVLYYGEFETFTDDNDDTPLSIVSSALFIYGGLIYAADYFLDDRKAVWEDIYLKTLQELQDQSDAEELAGGATVQPTYYFNSEVY